MYTIPKSFGLVLMTIVSAVNGTYPCIDIVTSAVTVLVCCPIITVSASKVLVVDNALTMVSIVNVLDNTLTNMVSAVNVLTSPSSVKNTSTLNVLVWVALSMELVVKVFVKQFSYV